MKIFKYTLVLSIVLSLFFSCDKDEEIEGSGTTDTITQIIGDTIILTDSIFLNGDTIWIYDTVVVTELGDTIYISEPNEPLANVDLENACDKMNDEFQAFKDLDVLTKMDHFYVVLMALEDIDLQRSGNSNLRLLKLMDFMRPLLAFREGKISMKAMLHDVHRSGSRSLEDAETLQEIYDALKGTYTWNKTTESWDETSGASIKFVFPSHPDTSYNNVIFETLYAGVDLDWPFDIEDDYTGDLPTMLSSVMSTNGEEDFKFNLGATYTSDGLIDSLGSEFSLDPFFMEVVTSYETQEIYSRMKLYHNQEVSLSYDLSLIGDFNFDNLNNLYEENIDLDNIETLLYTIHVGGGASFIDMRIDGDIESFAPSMRDLYERYDNGELDDNDLADSFIELVNANFLMSMVDPRDNDTICVFQPYWKTRTIVWTEWDWNSTNGQYEQDENSETIDFPGFSLIFPDGRKIDADTYLGDCNALYEEINLFFMDATNQIEGYDW